ncbi:MAG: phytanoyl-CoA dioxygenase family protein [Gemmatimonadales bacterium]
MTSDLAMQGYSVVPSGLTAEVVAELRAQVDPILARHAERGGVRDLFQHLPSLVSLAVGPLRQLVAPTLGPNAVAVRALLFDKTPVANWKVTWHQDVTISVSEYADCHGWGPWSRKAGAWHVRPPAAVLERMLTLRLHLDACGPDNGPVRVIPGSHQVGRFSDPELERVARSAEPVDCLVAEGGVLLMHPLILHASAPAAAPSHRRVIHIEYASADPLPDGFSWAESIA